MTQRFTRLLQSRFIEYVLGPGLLFVGGLMEGWMVKLAIGLPGFAFVAGSRFLGTRSREQSDARYTIFRLLTVMVNTLEAARPAPADRSLRANVMLVDSQREALRIGYYTTGYRPEELELEWHRGQGCAGEAWAKQESFFAPEQGELPVSVDDANQVDRPWNMTPEQIRLTAESIGSVLSVPVFLPNGNFVGVLNLDDSKELSLSLLNSTDVLAAAEDLADEVGEFLGRAGTNFPVSLG